MREFGVVTDALVNLNYKNFIFKDASHIALSFMMGSEVITEGMIPNEELFIKIKNQAFQMITPSTESFIEAFNEQKKLGYKKIIYLASSKILTDCYRQANLAKQILNDDAIYILDTETFGPGIEYLLEILYSIEKNYHFDEVIKELKEAISCLEILIISKPYLKNNMINLINKALPLNDVILFKNGFNKIKNILSNKTISFLSEYINKDIKIGIEPYVKVMSAFSFKEAKILQHELFTLNKDIKLTNYGQIPFIVAHRFDANAKGILYGFYGG